MTFEALQQAIARLIIARAEAHGNEAEQARINAKLDKLYNLKYTMLEQFAKAKSEWASEQLCLATENSKKSLKEVKQMLVINIRKENGDVAVFEGSVDELRDVINAELGVDTDKFISSVINARSAVLWNNVFGVYYNI